MIVGRRDKGREGKKKERERLPLVLFTCVQVQHCACMCNMSRVRHVQSSCLSVLIGEGERSAVPHNCIMWSERGRDVCMWEREKERERERDSNSMTHKISPTTRTWCQLDSFTLSLSNLVPIAIQVHLASSQDTYFSVPPCSYFELAPQMQ